MENQLLYPNLGIILKLKLKFIGKTTLSFAISAV
jgi:hypothetical protein